MATPVEPVRAEPDPEPERLKVAWPGLGYWARVTLMIALVLLALQQLRKASDVLALVLLAAVLAVGLDPAVQFLERRGLRRGVAVAVIFLSSLIGFGVFLWFAIPEFIDQAKTFAHNLPGLLNELAARDDWIGRAISDADVKTHLENFVSGLPSQIANSFGSILGVTSKITGLLFRLFTVAILTVYFMLSYPRARRAMMARAPVDDGPRLDRVVSTVARRIGGYVSGTFVLAGLSALAAALVLIVMGVKFWFPLAAWAGLAGVIPIVGSYLGAAPAVLIALADSPSKALIVLVYFVVWQQVRDYVVSPRVMKNSVDLSPAAVMVATIVGGSVGGFFGILLALPIAATIKAVMSEYLWKDQPPDDDQAAPEAPPGEPPDAPLGEGTGSPPTDLGTNSSPNTGTDKNPSAPA
jgi:predicted PurR-regulated permease PerM